MLRITSLRTRILIVVILLATIPLLMAGTLIVMTFYEIQARQVIDLQDERSQQIANEVEYFLLGNLQELQLTIDLQRIEQLLPENQRSLLLQLLAMESSFDNLAIVQADGQELARVSRMEVFTDLDLENRSDKPEFTIPIEENRIYFSEPNIEPTTGQLTITMALPVENLRTGAISHVLIGEVRLRLIAGLLESTDDGTVSYVIANNGRVVVHQNPSIPLRGDRISISEEMSGIGKGLNGGEVVFAVNDVIINDEVILKVVSEQNTSEAFVIIRNTLILLIGVLILTVIAAIILSIMGTRVIITPLQELAGVTEKVQAGDFSARATINSDDEIAVLANAFNSMTAQLSHIVTDLELLVTERTRHLQIAAEVSRNITTTLDEEELLNKIVFLTRESFDLYHVAIFLLSEENTHLLLRKDSSQVTRNARIPIESEIGLIPLVARTREPVLVNNVDYHPNYLPIPSLPHTRSELSLPLIQSGELIGVLDVQAMQVNRFDENDLVVMTTLADQIAVAIQNAHLFRELEIARKMSEDANKAKSQFLASVSHELRTPLNAIINFTQFVYSGMMGPVTEKQTDALRKVRDSGKHLLSLINDILDISKIESGELNLFIEGGVDIEQEIQAVIETANTLLIKKPEIELVVNIAPDLPLLIADKRRVRQIMLNLVSNACKFTETGNITISAYVRDGQFVFEVLDSGPGISVLDHETIFESFRQTSSGIRKGEGTGLGLSISRKLAEAHGGKLDFTSEVGKGSRFYVHLPMRNKISIRT